MNDAHVRKSHAIDRFHAWVDRSRSHGFMRPCLDFHHRMGLRVDVHHDATIRIQQSTMLTVRDLIVSYIIIDARRVYDMYMHRAAGGAVHVSMMTRHDHV